MSSPKQYKDLLISYVDLVNSTVKEPGFDVEESNLFLTEIADSKFICKFYILNRERKQVWFTMEVEDPQLYAQMHFTKRSTT